LTREVGESMKEKWEGDGDKGYEINENLR